MSDPRNDPRIKIIPIISNAEDAVNSEDWRLAVETLEQALKFAILASLRGGRHTAYDAWGGIDGVVYVMPPKDWMSEDRDVILPERIGYIDGARTMLPPKRVTVDYESLYPFPEGDKK